MVISCVKLSLLGLSGQQQQEVDTSAWGIIRMLQGQPGAEILDKGYFVM